MEQKKIVVPKRRKRYQQNETESISSLLNASAHA